MYEILIHARCDSPLQYGDAKRIFRRYLKEYFTVMKSIGCIFDENGNSLNAKAFTYSIILGESHAVLHTYPEKDAVFINICSCSDKYSKARMVSIGKTICDNMGLNIVNMNVVKRN